MQLQEAILSLQHIFQDMAILVLDQEELMNNIQSNVEATVANSKVAIKELHQANKYQRSLRLF
jgi:syntaxin 1A/syntaxin 1B/2/3